MGNIKNGKIIIELKSDLCVGSGYSYAGIIDSDSCYDEFGFPYIPARRLRGCIRESAEQMLLAKYSMEDIEKCFGRIGSDSGSALKIGNAHIKCENFEALLEDVKTGKNANRPEFSTQAIFGRFSHIVGQTKLEDGVAVEGSLRYTRTVNQKSPLDGGNLAFEAEISFDENNKELIKDAICATRHIGLKRNRGLGNVKMSLEENEGGYDNRNSKDDLFKVEEVDNDNFRLYFAVENVRPLMISASSEDESENYIPGQQILGTLAGRYLRQPGHSAEDDEFKDLFLNGKVIYSNLYPYDGKEIYYPAPEYLNRLKKTKEYVYTLGAELPCNFEKEDRKNPANGNQPKTLRGKFASVTVGNEVKIHELEKDVAYHHSHRNTHETENGDEGILYSHEVVRERQKFAGSIVVPKKYADEIKGLLLQDDLYFGKSKAAQYGKCRLIPFNGGNQKEKEGEIIGDILITFLSDAVLYNQEGNPTVFYDEVTEIVSKELGIEGAVQSEEYISGLITGLATGYLGVWNLRKPAVPVIKAGSFLVLKNPGKQLNKGMYTIGGRRMEGYGQVFADAAKGYVYGAPRMKKVTAEDEKKQTISNDAKKLITPTVFDRLLEEKINEAITEKTLKNISNTAVGRITLMVKESLAENNNDSNAAFENLKARIDSIKTESTKENGKQLLRSIEEFKNMADSGLSEKIATVFSKEENSKEMGNRWGKYALAILTHRKYEGRD